MACGCFPIVGDIESLREWVTPGVNGLLVEPNNPQALADAIILSLESPELLKNARTVNKKLIQDHAEVGLIRAQMKVFYQRFEK
jgi:glycosyltransferase involved in cell wall biosynthesis